jgi:hypothetical protein
VILKNEEEDKLFDIVKEVCLSQYVSHDDQELALETAKIDFESLLNRYIQKAFKLGKRYMKAKMLAEKPDIVEEVV